MKVICDTNIWYGLGSGAIQLPKKVQLIATWSNIIELAYSHPKTKADFDVVQWKSAATAILNHSKKIIELDPFEFATKRVFPTYNQFLNRDLKSILRTISEKDEPLSDDNYTSHQNFFDGFIKVKDEFVTKLLDIKSDVRKEFANDGRFKELFKKNQKDYRRIRAADILVDINAYLNQKNEEIGFDNGDDIEKSLKSVESDFDFYISVKQRFLHNLSLIKSMTVEPNDFIDLTNLMYVDSETYYWTLENRWLNIIRESGQGSKLL